mgnify:CR=1 FL=1
MNISICISHIAYTSTNLCPIGQCIIKVCSVFSFKNVSCFLVIKKMPFARDRFYLSSYQKFYSQFDKFAIFFMTSSIPALTGFARNRFPQTYLRLVQVSLEFLPLSLCITVCNISKTGTRLGAGYQCDS